MSDRPPVGRPWPVLGIGWLLAALVLIVSIIAFFVPIAGPHLDLLLIIGLALAWLIG